ncbi:MAG TPA: GNAT family N-acetyltransferase [Terriglobales bacterium]|jgi:ribosomal protein S18 acetylase RimI-like enzyme|nr:GNAT family N-acetyltransferase [Terriglobales bacterium]
MEILDLRHFSSADLRPLLEDEIATWGRLLSWDYTTSAEMILRYMDAKILPGYAAIERGSIFGYSFFVYEQNKGVIGDLFVRNGARSGGHDGGGHEIGQREVEEKLLTHVIETLQQSPGIHRVEAQLLAQTTGEVARPFVQQGFSRHPRVFMSFDIGKHALASSPNTPAFPAQFEIRPWAEAEYQSAAALITAAYRGHVDSEINDQYRTLTGSLRFLNNIVRFPGCGTFDPQASFVVHERKSRTLVGLILCSQVRPDVGHITQVCVLPEYRSAGLGEVMMAAATRNLRGRGFRFISLTVTEANDRAIALYKRIGFEEARVFDAFVWEG